MERQLSAPVEVPYDAQRQPVKSTRKSKKFNPDADLEDKLREVVLDDNKSYTEKLKFVENEIKESTRTTAFKYSVKCFLEDGAYALHRAVESESGFMQQADEKTMSGKNPPTMIDVRFADGGHKKVPFGTINLPTFGKEAQIQMQYDAMSRTMLLQGNCEKRFIRLMDQIVDKMRRLVDEDSIYKGRAIKIVDEISSPEFIDLSKIDEVALFLTPQAKFATTPIEARIEFTDHCIREHIDLKFGALLCGEYGTGKSLYAFKLALKAIRNGWSFVYCPQPEKALYVIEIANMLSRNGKGVVVFLEDIDKILHTRSEMTNQISIMLDGGETKRNNVITIFTTNHLERIDPTFVRGKRIGTIVTLTHPDKETAAEMIKNYMVNQHGTVILDDDITPAAELIESEQIVPAFIAEILERVKAHLVYTKKTTVTCADIIASIESYKTQMNIARVRTGGKTKSEQLVDVIKDLFTPEQKPLTEAGLKGILKGSGFNIR